MIARRAIKRIIPALLNILRTGCAAAPFYNRYHVNTSSQYGPKLPYELEKVVEKTIQGNAPYWMVFLSVLFATGIGILLNQYLFHGAFQYLHPVAMVAVGVKLFSV